MIFDFFLVSRTNYNTPRGGGTKRAKQKIHFTANSKGQGHSSAIKNASTRNSVNPIYKKKSSVGSLNNTQSYSYLNYALNPKVVPKTKTRNKKTITGTLDFQDSQKSIRADNPASNGVKIAGKLKTKLTANQSSLTLDKRLLDLYGYMTSEDGLRNKEKGIKDFQAVCFDRKLFWVTLTKKGKESDVRLIDPSLRSFLHHIVAGELSFDNSNGHSYVLGGLFFVEYKKFASLDTRLFRVEEMDLKVQNDFERVRAALKEVIGNTSGSKA